MIGDDNADDESRHVVVVNEQGQYSLWPAVRELPGGWRAVGEPKSRAECLAYIETVWSI